MDDRAQAAALGGAMLLWSGLGQADRAIHRSARWTIFKDLAMFREGTHRRVSNTLSTTKIAAGIAFIAWAAATAHPDKVAG